MLDTSSLSVKEQQLIRYIVVAHPLKNSSLYTEYKQVLNTSSYIYCSSLSVKKTAV
jgi:hypothetical protein